MAAKDKKMRVLVFGATGQQGGSVLFHVANQKKYTVRAFVRNPEKLRKKLQSKFDNAGNFFTNTKKTLSLF